MNGCRRALIFAPLFTFNNRAFAEAKRLRFLFDAEWEHSQLKEQYSPNRWIGSQPVQWARRTIYRNCWQLVQAAGTDRLVRDSAILTSSGLRSIRVTVKPGDTLEWSGERAEFAIPILRNGERLSVDDHSPRMNFQFGLRIPADWTPPARDPTTGTDWGIVLQCHGPDTLKAPPSLALGLDRRLYIEACAGDLRVKSAKNKDAVRTYVDYSLTPNSWLDLLLSIQWSSGEGEVTLFKIDSTGAKQVIYRNSGPTLQYINDTVAPHYIKYGFYRSRSAGESRLWLTPLIIFEG